MKERQIKIALASLLSNIGRLAVRASSGKDSSGREFLSGCSVSDELMLCAGLMDSDAESTSGTPDTGENVHGAADPETAGLRALVRMADDIAASLTGHSGGKSGSAAEDPDCQFESIYNLLNLDEREASGAAEEKLYYSAGTLKDGIRFPLTRTAIDTCCDVYGEDYEPLSAEFYQHLLDETGCRLKTLEFTDSFLSSLMNVLEVNLTYVPAFCSSSAPSDISMYDHMKMSVAVALALDEYLEERIPEASESGNQRTAEFLKLLSGSEELLGSGAFVMFSMDLCGIQDFIYTITTEKALKTLRSRSFYLELLMEHMIDMLLDEFSLCRASLIYSGGGHCYILLPNLQSTGQRLADFCRGINRWLTDTFGISLFLSSGFSPCSPYSLCNRPEGSFSRIFTEIGDMITRAKNCRYSAQDLMRLNGQEHEDYTRECRICRRTGHLDSDGKCMSCLQFEEFSNRIQNGGDYFAVLRGSEPDTLPLPGDCCLAALTGQELKARMSRHGEKPARVYSKNSFTNELDVTTRLWVGDYFYDRVMENLAGASTGIRRIAVLRADVDNLGQTFIRGFESRKYGTRFVNLARTAALSRSLSMFFKYHINTILSRREFSLGAEKTDPERKVTVVYSGGDDVFLIGAWDEVVECAVDLSRALKKYTSGALTISAGIGIYQQSYPVSAAAEETAAYEDASKSRPGKSAVTLFSSGSVHDENGAAVDDGTYSWDEFKTVVAGEKYRILADFFGCSSVRGNSFLYRILELIEGRGEKINFARLAYLLSRLEPRSGAPDAEKKAYSRFAQNIYRWMGSGKDCRQLKTAIQLYVYMNRERSEEEA
jgi:CRISPR-associated protein Csm1